MFTISILPTFLQRSKIFLEMILEIYQPMIITKRRSSQKMLKSAYFGGAFGQCYRKGELHFPKTFTAWMYVLRHDVCVCTCYIWPQLHMQARTTREEQQGCISESHPLLVIFKDNASVTRKIHSLLPPYHTHTGQQIMDHITQILFFSEEGDMMHGRVLSSMFATEKKQQVHHEEAAHNCSPQQKMTGSFQM